MTLALSTNPFDRPFPHSAAKSASLARARLIWRGYINPAPEFRTKWDLSDFERGEVCVYGDDLPVALPPARMR